MLYHQYCCVSYVENLKILNYTDSLKFRFYYSIYKKLIITSFLNKLIDLLDKVD
jgi:hypothetical protein